MTTLPGMANVLSNILDSVRVDLGDALPTEAAVRDAATRRIRYLVESSGESAGVDETQLLREAVDELAGFGALQPLLDDPEIEELWINAPDRIFVARGGVTELTDLSLEAHQIRHLVERMLASTGRRVDASSPFVDASLPDGSRLHVVIPEITAAHWSVNIRKFSRTVKTLDDLVERKSLSRKVANTLTAEMRAGTNILVSGATQAGKTTMLNALLSSVAHDERIVTVEETFELNCLGRDVVAMQCRQANLEGSGEVTLRRLIKEALRMRPDRLVVGEVREAESLDLLIALNSGLPGACTIHGNSAKDALAKLCTLPLLAGRNIDVSFVVPAVASSIGLVVHCELDARGQRRVREVVRVTGRVINGQVETESVFS
jgi:pilus assembly protein CpaF